MKKHTLLYIGKNKINLNYSKFINFVMSADEFEKHREEERENNESKKLFKKSISDKDPVVKRSKETGKRVRNVIGIENDEDTKKANARRKTIKAPWEKHPMKRPPTRAELKHEIAALKTENVSLNMTILNQDERIKLLKAEVVSLTAEIERLKNEYEFLSDLYEAQVNKGIVDEEKHKKLQAIIETKKESIKSLEGQVSIFLEDIEKKQKEFDDKQKELENSEFENRKLAQVDLQQKKEIHSKNLRIGGLESENTQLEAKETELKSDLDDAQNEIDELDAKQKTILQEKKELDGKYENIQIANANLRDQVQSQKDKIHALNNKIQDISTEITTMQETISELRKRLAEAVSNAYEDAVEIEELKKELDKKILENNSLANEHEELLQEQTILLAELEAIEDKLAKVKIQGKNAKVILRSAIDGIDKHQADQNQEK